MPHFPKLLSNRSLSGIALASILTGIYLKVRFSETYFEKKNIPVDFDIKNAQDEITA